MYFWNVFNQQRKLKFTSEETNKERTGRGFVRFRMCLCCSYCLIDMLANSVLTEGFSVLFV